MKLKDLGTTKEAISRVTRERTKHGKIDNYMCYWELIARIGKNIYLEY